MINNASSKHSFKQLCLFITIFAVVVCFSIYKIKTHISLFTCDWQQNYITTSNENPLFSIVLPTYNREKYLPRAICSVLAQKFTDFELLIIDDGSKDNTEKLVKKFADKDKRILYIKNEKNSGLIYSANRGIDLAKGRYITRLDSDDIIYPNLFDEYKKFIDENPDTTLFSSLLVSLKDSGDLNSSSELANHFKKSKEIDIFFTNPISNVGTTLNKEFLDSHNLRYENEFIHAEDYGLISKILMHGGKIKILRKNLTGYREHETNGKKYRETQTKTSVEIKKRLLQHFVNDWNFNFCHNYKNLNDKARAVFSAEEIEDAIKRHCKE